jgi:diguanylate cyclase (GGDEF)-like protein
LARWYVAVVPLAALALTVLAASRTTWHAADLGIFLMLVGCGMVSAVAAPRAAYLRGTMTRDFLTVWVLPAAVLLPPVYAMVTPVPLIALTQWLVHRGIVYRRVFTAAAIGLAYGAASLTFRAIPASLAGGAIGGGAHAFTWTTAVVAAELVGWLGHHVLLLTAARLCDPTVRFADFLLARENLQTDVAQIDLGIVITLVVAVHPVLALFAVPTVPLIRRYMMHAQLLAQSRLDSKTGLLNVATWEREAEGEITRAIRTRSPLSVALIDIDHFKAVNDTHGHLAGDMALRTVTDAVREQLRDYDLIGRFGGEEFVVLLPQTHEAAALVIAERLRAHIAALSIPVSDAQPGAHVRLTVSIGVAGLDAADGGVTDLLAAADAALYHAKQTGRNKTHVAANNGLLVEMVPAARDVQETAGAQD